MHSTIPAYMYVARAYWNIVCMYLSMCVCMYHKHSMHVCVYVCMRLRKTKRIHVYACMHAWMNVYMYEVQTEWNTCVVHVCMHVCTYVYMYYRHAAISTYVHTCTYIHHVCMYENNFSMHWCMYVCITYVCMRTGASWERLNEHVYFVCCAWYSDYLSSFRHILLSTMHMVLFANPYHTISIKSHNSIDTIHIITL